MELATTLTPSPVWVAMGAAWMVGGYGITLFLPVRSSLYACLPSAGAALAGAAYLNSLWEVVDDRLRRRMLATGVAIAIISVPVHWTRNQSWIRPADLSAQVLESLPGLAAALPLYGGLLIVDDLTANTRLDHAFGSQIRVAAMLYLGRPLNVWVSPQPNSGPPDLLTLPPEDRIALTLAIREGRLIRADNR